MKLDLRKWSYSNKIRSAYLLQRPCRLASSYSSRRMESQCMCVHECKCNVQCMYVKVDGVRRGPSVCQSECVCATTERSNEPILTIYWQVIYSQAATAALIAIQLNTPFSSSSCFTTFKFFDCYKRWQIMFICNTENYLQVIEIIRTLRHTAIK